MKNTRFNQINPNRWQVRFVVFSMFVLSMLMQAQEQVMLFDFGGSDSQTSPPPVFWNNVTQEMGSAIFSVVDLIDSDGNDLALQLFIDEPFDFEPNTRGSVASGSFPASATGDSLINSSGGGTLALVAQPGNTQTLSFTFYAADSMATDNRETRYSVRGATTRVATLNPSGNVDNTASIHSVQFNSEGEIIIQLSPGPNHSSSSSLVYIGAMRIESSAGWTALVDFGSDQNTTTVVGGGPSLRWNNVNGGIANSDVGILTDIVATDGTPSNLNLLMVSRFNGVNTNGATGSGLYPDSATQDSWYANTETFSGLSNVTPIFKITGLDSATAYDFVFYASRMGVSDNRETVFTLTGATTRETSLNVANNISETAVVAGMTPDAGGEVTIALTPGPNNNNGNHFIYLGVLKLDAPAKGMTYLFDFGGDATTEIEVEDSGERWNNITESIGQTNDGISNRLLTREGLRTDINLEMISRFNGVNRNGSVESSLFPESATRDSMFGNTEAFSGLSNVLPSFKLTGLNPENAYSFTFYGSRTATDNRETRYTVAGSNTKTGDLNTASNVDEVATVPGIMPDAAGEITVSIGPGPNNNNGSHFTYLGVMKVEWVRSFVPRILIDAGGTTFPTTLAEDLQVWNNFQGSVGQTDNGVLSGLQTVNGTSTGFGIQMLARFNGVNEAGTDQPAPYPTSATRDSLFGNTEDWSGLTDVFPSFQVTGLDPATAYTLTFYGSRNASDNRETKYEVTGSNSAEVFLNIAGNIDQTAVAERIQPKADGTITVNISPGPNNNNANHFTYLGVLQMDWEGGLPPSKEPETVALSNIRRQQGTVVFVLNGRSGETYSIQGTSDFSTWTEDQSVSLSGDTLEVTLPTSGDFRYFRVVR